MSQSSTVSRFAAVVLPALLVALLIGAVAQPGLAEATPSLRWSSPAAFDSGRTPSAVSCASESLCVAVDHQGYALTSPDPTASTPSWSTSPIDLGQSLNAISCVASGPCVAVDGRGYALVSSQPSASTWPAEPIDAGRVLTGVSCPTASLCVAVDESGNVLTSEHPASGGWETASIDPTHHLVGVSCLPQSLCVAVDNAGDLLSSANPMGGASAWHTQTVDFGALTGVSCTTGETCVAVDAAGDALASNDADATAATWGLTPVDAQSLTGISCASSGLCVAVDGSGQALASDDPAAPIPAWGVGSVDPDPLAAVSCLPGGFCMGLDTDGRSLSARVPAPAATTLPAAEVNSVAATLTGAVDPNDAVLNACQFEYGGGAVGEAYTGSVPCSTLPVANEGTQDVAAQLTGLSANTTYHYRVIASSPAGTGVGVETTFTTAVSSQVALVQPHPSIAGTPASGQRLTCNPGTPAGTTAQLSYAWLRDQIPIPEATASTYTVKFQDSGHHLQCQVTATDGGGSATAKSGFVTIPAGGVPASAGETTVGKATFAKGRLSVPVACSPHAGGGCEITLRLTVSETLNGKRVVGIAARSPRGTHAGAAALRHATVTLASTRVRLAGGTHKTVTAVLNATGRRLSGANHHLSAYVEVSGTVIGVIEAQLSRQRLTLGASASSSGVELSLNGGSRATATAASVQAATPYMGWDTYFALGGNYSESTILTQASQLISLGLEKRGYRYVWLDVGWWHGTRNAAGQITVSPTQWPHGFAWLTRTLHAAGLLVGIYTDAGPNGCGGAGQGSYGHYQQDANTFAAWGFDAVKVDFCGGAEYKLNPTIAYTEFHTAIEKNSSHRPMLLSICDFLQPEQYAESEPPLGESAFTSYTFGPSVGNSWRTDTDVGAPKDVSFTDVLRNMDADAAQPQAAGPGHWNDPDYLAPDQGMSATQFDTQFSMWGMLAAPLMIGDDLTKIGPASLAAVRNSEVIAIDQDPAGVQGTLLSTSGDGQVWVKPLTGGARAVALLNRGSHPTRIETSASAVGLPSAVGYNLRNVWTHQTATTTGSIAAEVPGDATVLLRVSTR